MKLCENIKAQRLSLDMTLEEVAKIVGVTRQTILKYENGIISNIPSDKIELLAQALHTTPAYLMGWADDPADDGDSMEVSTDVMRMSKYKKEPTVKDDGLSEVERLFLSLPPERREEVLRFMEYLASQSGK